MSDSPEIRHYDPTVRAYFAAIGGMPDAELPPEGIPLGDDREVIDMDDLDLSEMIHAFIDGDDEDPGEPVSPAPSNEPDQQPDHTVTA